MPLTLRNPIPTEVSKGEVCLGVSTGGQHGFHEWRDGSGNIHLVASFNGVAEAYSTEPYFIHHINLDTDVSHLTSCAKGYLGKTVYDPFNDRLYCCGVYSGSFGWLNPTTGAFTKLKDSPAGLYGSMIYGGDDRIYFVENACVLNSYGIADGLYSYGDFMPATAAVDYNALAVDTTHVYFGVINQTTWLGNSWWTLFIGEIKAAKETFVEYDFADEHDRGVAFLRDYNTKELLCRRLLVDNTTYKYYSFTGGVLTEVTKALNPEYAWNEAGTAITGNYGPTVIDYSPYVYTTGTPADKTWWGWEIDPAQLAPVPGTQEYSKIGYRPEEGGDWSYSQKTFTEPWQSTIPFALTHKSARDIYLTSYDYGPASTVDYDTPSPVTNGYHQISPYDVLKLPDSTVYMCGYSADTLLWNPASAWTLHSGNATRFDYPAAGAPNPYKLNIARSGIQHHYRFCLHYDSAGKVWGGGNATRTTTNPGAGNVWWYKPSDGTYGYVFDGTGGKPDWDDTEVYFRSMCHALSRTKMVVSGHDGWLHVVNCADATIDGSFNLGTYAYMVEVADDQVFGITLDGDVFLFKPSDQTMIVAPFDCGLAYTPFGWESNSYTRMNYKVELGPDGYAWMFMGSRIYKFNPTTCLPTLVKSLSTYYKLKFIDKAGDQSVYDLILYGNGKSLLVIPEIFYTPAAADSNPGPPLANYKTVGGGDNASLICGKSPAAVCGGRV